MTGLELLKAPEATAGEIADIISAPCPPTIPAHCDGVSCRECWLTWLTGEPIKEKEPPDKRTAPDDAPAYSDLSDMEFGEMFSAGISDAVRAFKTSGSGMAQAIQNLGASATTAQVPLEEQLSVLGNEVALKDEMLLMEETIINDTFLDTTPQELISYFLAQAGLSKMKLSSKTYPTRKMLPIRRQTAVQAINAVNAAWGLRVPFFFSGGVFYWDEKPEQKKVYTFERGVNILNLRRAGGVWELETVSAPFIKHSHKINLIHPQVSGEVEVSKVVSKTNDSGFIRTYIYF